jgi:hypothetical protein
VLDTSGGDVAAGMLEASWEGLRLDKNEGLGSNQTPLPTPLVPAVAARLRLGRKSRLVCRELAKRA